MAYVQHTDGGRHALSIDFSYVANETLSFDMLVVSNRGGNNAAGGVTLSFLNSFNSTLGSASLVNHTDPSALGPNDILIDAAQHSYSALLSDYAFQAGLGVTDPITKVSLSFFATAGGNSTNHSSSIVRFDNVNVSAVPIPTAVWLFGSGLLGLTAIARRKKA